MAATVASVTRQVEAIGPHRLCGLVVAGFKRGSKELGWPTANLDPHAFERRLDAATEGVYVGWAKVDDPKLAGEAGAVYKAVLSIGWNVCARAPSLPSARCHPHRTPTGCSLLLLYHPGLCHPSIHGLCVRVTRRPQPHFDDLKERTIEAYICHDFAGADFYDAPMRLLICAFLRPQAKFDSFDALISAITGDVEFGQAALDRPELVALRDDEFFRGEPKPTTDPPTQKPGEA